MKCSYLHARDWPGWCLGFTICPLGCGLPVRGALFWTAALLSSVWVQREKGVEELAAAIGHGTSRVGGGTQERSCSCCSSAMDSHRRSGIQRFRPRFPNLRAWGERGDGGDAHRCATLIEYSSKKEIEWAAVLCVRTKKAWWGGGGR